MRGLGQQCGVWEVEGVEVEEGRVGINTMGKNEGGKGIER